MPAVPCLTLGVDPGVGVCPSLCPGLSQVPIPVTDGSVAHSPALPLGAGTARYLSGGRAGAPRTPTLSHREEFILDCSIRLLGLARERQTFLCSCLVVAVNKGAAQLCWAPSWLGQKMGGNQPEFLFCNKDSRGTDILRKRFHS